MSAENQYELNAVPFSERKSTISMTVVMLGLTFFSASMWTGGKLGASLEVDQFFTAIFIGNLLLGVYTSCLGYIGAKTGLSTHLLARYSFGTKGSWLPSLILSGTQVGWFGVGVAMFALPIHKYTGIDPLIITVLAGAAMTVTVYFGMKALVVLGIIAVPAIALFGSYSVSLAVESVGGLEGLFNIHPMPDQLISMNTAVMLVVGSFISAGTLTADFIRFGPGPKRAVAITMIAFFIGNSLMFIFGAAGAKATGQAEISDIMVMQGLLIPAIVVLGLNIWTTNDNALYASGLGFSNITGLPTRWISLVNGIVGTAFALWLYNNFIGWLEFLSTAIPPIGGVVIADFILRSKHYQNFDKQQFDTVNWLGIGAVIVGISCGKFFSGIPPINAVLGAALFYTGATLLTKKVAR